MGIGFFQFDNLVRNRVPFALAMTAPQVDLATIYSGQELEHLQRYTLPLGDQPDLLDIIVRLQAQRYQAHDPVICVCADGEKSKTWANQLEQKGFKNCYYVEGGFAALLKEFHESRRS